MVLFTLKKPRRSIVSGPTQYIDPNRGHYGTVSPTKPKPSRLKNGFVNSYKNLTPIPFQRIK